MGRDASNIWIKHLSESKTWRAEIEENQTEILCCAAKCTISLLHLPYWIRPLLPRAALTCRLPPHQGPLGCQSRRRLLTVVQEEPRWRLPTAVLDLAGGEAFVVATVAVSTPAGFLFACSLSVFICGLHLVCTSHTGICRLLILLSKHLSWPGRPKKKKESFHRDLRGGMSLEFLQLRNWNDCCLKKTTKYVLQLLPLPLFRNLWQR